MEQWQRGALRGSRQQAGSGVQLSLGGQQGHGGTLQGMPGNWRGAATRDQSCRMETGLRHRPHPQSRSAVGQGTPTPRSHPPTPQGQGQLGGGLALCTLRHPAACSHPARARGSQAPLSPFTAASVVPGAGGAEVQRGGGARVGGEAVPMTMVVEGLQRVARDGHEVLGGERRVGCHGASVRMLWDQPTLEGTCKVSPSRVVPEMAPQGQQHPESSEQLGNGVWAPEGARSPVRCW